MLLSAEVFIIMILRKIKQSYFLTHPFPLSNLESSLILFL